MNTFFKYEFCSCLYYEATACHLFLALLLLLLLLLWLLMLLFLIWFNFNVWTARKEENKKGSFNENELLTNEYLR